MQTGRYRFKAISFLLKVAHIFQAFAYKSLKRRNKTKQSKSARYYIVIPPANKVWGHIVFTLSVFLSVCLSLVCGYYFDTHILRNRCMEKNLKRFDV